MLSDTIVAISTALNNSAIAIVRLSGDEAFDIAQEIFDRDLSKHKANEMIYGHIVKDGQILDEVYLVKFSKGRSFTYEDMVEINCHGGVYITREVLNLCLSKGARLALRGEFSKRAYLNGRIDLAQAESINDIINAQNSIQAKSAIKGISGSIAKLVDPLLEKIMAMIGMIEVNIDYPEYDDVTIITHEHLLPEVQKWIKELEVMIQKAERFRIVKDGLKVAIIGKPNVGKSSLLNALLKKDKAIVTEIAGTTRDLVEDSVVLDNITLHLIDTAGIREASDVVEKIGIERSLKAIEEADLVILLIDASRPRDDEDERLYELVKDKKHLVVFNKTDLNDQVKGMKIAAQKGAIDELLDYFNNLCLNDLSLIDEDILNNERQIALARSSRDTLKEVLKAALNGVDLDLLSSDLYTAYHDLSMIVGKDYEDDLIDHLFKNFCLGK